ncbi:hypothetical protein FBU59_001335 [Linderina macrospora]|uniref:Uncharacterized protein n=1 Tax=Linderina macrospora TaxID=4868 RepID=A0ACC1JE43_9FUNG|nr:hypothetical protein FBU59_001335 [Linderina macrospora]
MSKSFKRGPNPAVRKNDIRVVPNTSAGPAIKPAFTAATQVGSGDAHDLCYQRLTAWLHMVENYHEYFTSMCAAELDLATVYARVGDILQVPLHEHTLMMPHGIADMSKRLKGLQQGMVENHCAISRHMKGAVKGLEEARDEVKQHMGKYARAVGNVHRELNECRGSIRQRVSLLEATLEAVEADAQREVAKDPFLVRLEIEALRRKRRELELRLAELVRTEQQHIRDFEPQLIERLKLIVGGYMEMLGNSGKQQRQTARASAKTSMLLDETAEWSYFATAFSDVLANEHKDSEEEVDCEGEWIKVLREGVVALKEQGPMFRSTWQSKYCVLTARGYLHVFRSQGDVAKCAPETSVFLPNAQVSLVRAGTLQIRNGGKFSRCRLILQDGSDSLELWRSLMQRVRGRTSSSSSGMATPPESSEDEMQMRPRANTEPLDPLKAPRQGNAKLMEPPNHKRLTAGTQNLYMLPLESTPACSLDLPLRSRPFSCLSPMVNISELSFDGNSPGISDFPVPSPRLSLHAKDMSGTSQQQAFNETSLGDGPHITARTSWQNAAGGGGHGGRSIVPLLQASTGVTAAADAVEAKHARRRSMVHSGHFDPSLIDVHNPYLGEFFTKSTRVPSVGGQSKEWRNSVQAGRVVSQPVGCTTSPPLPLRMVGPCVSRGCIDEREDEG